MRFYIKVCIRRFIVLSKFLVNMIQLKRLTRLKRSSTLTSHPLDEHHAVTQPHISVYSMIYAMCLHRQMKRKLEVTIREDLVSTSKMDAAKHVKVMELLKERCISCLMSSYHVKFVKEKDIIERHWRLNIKIKLSLMY